MLIGGTEMEAAPLHVPVMLREVIAYLRPKPGGIYVDATVGAGGHARAILEQIGPAGLLIGLDRDPEALQAAWEALAPYREQLLLIRENFVRAGQVLDRLGIPAVDGFLFDLGVSSPQLDRPERGFSYWHDAPLDMRMDPRQPVSAYHLVNGLSEEELAHVLFAYGQERWAQRIARCIVRERERRPIETTGQLAAIVKAAIPAAARRSGPHPARRTFQALRIAVNDELGAVQKAVEMAVARTRAGGRICFLSFHSLEDRAVKEGFRRLAGTCTCPPGLPACACGVKAAIRVLTPRPVLPGKGEVAANPRARSARLRAAERLGVELRVITGGRSE